MKIMGWTTVPWGPSALLIVSPFNKTLSMLYSIFVVGCLKFYGQVNACKLEHHPQTSSWCLEITGELTF